MGVRENYPDNDQRVVGEMDSVLVRMNNVISGTYSGAVQLETSRITLENVKMINSSLGFAVGGKGKVYKTTNGNTWNEIAGPNTTATLTTIFALDDNNLIVGDDQGHIWKHQSGNDDPSSPTATPTLIPGATITPTPTPNTPPSEYMIWKHEYTGSLATNNTDYNHDGKVDMVDFEIGRRNGKPGFN